MADKASDSSKPASKQALDLNALSGLDFGPNWADETKKQSRPKNYDQKGDTRGGDRRSGGGSRDRRPSGGARPPRHDGGEGRPPRRDDRGDRGGDRRRQAPVIFQPTVHVDIYPQDEAFEALVKRLRATARTYQLFEIAHLLLEKPERYVVVVTNLPTGGVTPPLHFSVPGHLPFETEEAAISHVLSNNLDLFFDVEEIEVEPPKGNFQMVNRCTVTGELLGPPNYHRYQEFLQKHYAARISCMSFERFQSKIETVKEQEQIDAWLESMKKGARYTVKDHQEGEPESLESLEAVRHFLLQHRKDKVVGSGEHVRFAGRDILNLPVGDIRRSVEAYVEKQLHFPLEAANNIRGRLRRHKFTVYKKGSKGVSYVCAVKRKFRDSKTVFTDSISNLIDFIEKHPDLPASKLPKLYIDIDTEKQKPVELKVSEAEVAAAAEAKKAAKEAAEAAAESTETTEVASEAPVEAATVEAIVAPDAEASTEATPVVELTAEEQAKLNQLMLDLRWLITEGYVTEYGDGKLYAAPTLPEAKPKEPKAKVEAPNEAVAAEVAPKEAAAVEEPAPAEPEVTAEVAKEVVEESAHVEPAPEVVVATEEAAAEAVAPEPEEAPKKAASDEVDAEAPADATPEAGEPKA
ncbi:MAG: hypothetical protein NWS71_00775 [Opitutales bacterium]|nr:hypothetical protein [Opitutales bacterium]MDP4776536.1 hypothetical protein [Opitutales bacterium]